MAIVTQIVHSLNCLRLLPLYALMKVHPRRQFFDAERQHWYRAVLGKEGEKQNFSDTMMLLTLPEYRSVLYWRMGGLRYFIAWWASGERTLHIEGTDYRNAQPGLVVHHGHSTRIACRHIGQGCEIWHNVTLGTARSFSGEFPTLGNHVKICTGAIVLGGITIGDNATIAAGSVVLKDVPADAVVAGNPARIIRLKGERISPPAPLS